MFSFFKNSVLAGIKRIFKSEDADLNSYFSQIEELLLSADLGVETTGKIINILKKKIVTNNPDANMSIVRGVLEDIINSVEDVNDIDKTSNTGLNVVMLVGINGVGKTTTIAKLAKKYKDKGKKIIVGAADTFRAAADEQIEQWCKKLGIDVEFGEAKSTPAAVVYKTLERAKKECYDVAIIDTAGRLHNNENLMAELAKMYRNALKFVEKQHVKVFLVVDGSTGQNVFNQLEKFRKVIDVDALIVTKADGIAKSGFIIGLYDQYKIPVEYLGTGEGINDLIHFDKNDFIKELVCVYV